MNNNPSEQNVFTSWQNVLLNRHCRKEVESFYRFFGVWTMFNSLYKQDSQLRLEVTDFVTERLKVESFAHSEAFGQIHSQYLLSDPEYKGAVNFISQRSPHPPEWMGPDSRKPDVRIWNLEKKFKDKYKSQGICDGENDLKGLLGCLYVTRCNLFHGSKEIGNQSDIQLLDNSFKVLTVLLHHYEFI